MKRLAAALAAVAALAGAVALAQPAPARFDYWLLSLSWSPSFCAEADRAAREPRQCGRDRAFAFVVHGLWPQYERGWPSGCVAGPRDAPAPLVTSMLDIMPSPGLVEHEWDDHGKCSGLTPQAYFDRTRRARASVTIPSQYVATTRTLMVTGAEVERAFVAANPGLTPASVAVQCDRTRLREVRICLAKDLRPRACGSDVRDRCGPGKVAMPPVRPGR